MVRVAGIEPARISPRDFKSLASTYFTTLAYLLYFYYTTSVELCQLFLAGPLGIEPRIAESKSDVIPFHYEPTDLERITRFELVTYAWQAQMLPTTPYPLYNLAPRDGIEPPS
jgi:hypothetical protein